MRTLAMRALRSFWEAGHADAEGPLRAWFRTVERASWNGTGDVRASYRSVDFVGRKAIFNIKGNDYRLICEINFESKYVLVKWLGTHSEYDRLTKEEIENL